MENLSGAGTTLPISDTPIDTSILSAESPFAKSSLIGDAHAFSRDTQLKASYSSLVSGVGVSFLAIDSSVPESIKPCWYHKPVTNKTPQMYAFFNIPQFTADQYTIKSGSYFTIYHNRNNKLTARGVNTGRTFQIDSYADGGYYVISSHDPTDTSVVRRSESVDGMTAYIMRFNILKDCYIKKYQPGVYILWNGSNWVGEWYTGSLSKPSYGTDHWYFDDPQLQTRSLWYLNTNIGLVQGTNQNLKVKTVAYG